MRDAIERSNALYKALKDFVWDGNGVYKSRDVVYEEIDNFLDDIEKRRDLELDMFALDGDIIDVIYTTILTEYRTMFCDPENSPHIIVEHLIDNVKFQDSVQKIREIVVEEMREQLLLT